MKWRKPELVCFKTKDLLCKVKAKAFSVNACSSNYDENDGGEGGDLDCGVLSQCIEVGTLFGCNDENYCSSLAYLLR